MSLCGCLSRSSLCGPMMDWRPDQGVPRLSPDDHWDRLQPPRDPTNGLSSYRKLMNGLMDGLMITGFIENATQWMVYYVPLSCVLVCAVYPV